jgi:Ca-activated chloride channel family protein
MKNRFKSPLSPWERARVRVFKKDFAPFNLWQSENLADFEGRKPQWTSPHPNPLPKGEGVEKPQLKGCFRWLPSSWLGSQRRRTLLLPLLLFSAATLAEPAASYALRPADNRWPAGDVRPDALSPDLLAANYYLVLDGSGSMNDDECADHRTKMQVAKEAIREFARQVPEEANLGLYVFDNRGSKEQVALGRGNRAQFEQAVDAVAPGGNTPLKTSIAHAYQSLMAQARRQLGYGQYNLVVVTDGIASPAAQDPTPVVQTVLGESPVLVRTIGFCIRERHPLNLPGRTLYRAANDPASLRQGLEAVLAESPDFTVPRFQDPDRR